MITYHQVTLIEIVNEVLGRLQTYQKPTNIDWQEIVNAVNQSIIEAVSFCYGLIPEAFIEQSTVTNGSFMGERFIKEINLLVIDGNGIYRDARYANPTEIYNTTDERTRTSWVHSIEDNPIYTMFGNRVYIVNTTDRDPIVTSTATGEFTYHAYPLKLYSDTDTLVMPYEYIELVYLHTLIRLLTPGESMEYMKVVYRELEMTESSLYQRNRQANVIEKAEIETMVEDNRSKFKTTKKK